METLHPYVMQRGCATSSKLEHGLLQPCPGRRRGKAALVTKPAEVCSFGNGASGGARWGAELQVSRVSCWLRCRSSERRLDGNNTELCSSAILSLLFFPNGCRFASPG